MKEQDDQDAVGFIYRFWEIDYAGVWRRPVDYSLYQNEVVNRFGWMGNEEFGQALAFGNALPGPIATKLAAYIGFKVAGWSGAVVAVGAVVLPTALLMVLLVNVMYKLQSNIYIKGMIKGIQPVIFFVMLAMLAFDFAKFAFQKGSGMFSFLPFF